VSLEDGRPDVLPRYLRGSLLKARIVPVADLTAEDHAQMFAVFGQYYDHVSVDRFLADLARKDDVILLVDRDGRVQGFSTMKNLDVEVEGTRIYGLFSGDTVVAREHWGQRVLGRAFLRYLFVQSAKRPTAPFYWFLISKGYKTYLLMANNFPEHFPRYERAMSPRDKAILDAFGAAMYPREYDPETGLIAFDESHGNLRHGVAAITRELRIKNPRVAFFTKRNPTWADGTELACIAKMTWSMPLRYALKARLKKAVHSDSRLRAAVPAYARDGGE
jgi:hypothetical protein